MKWERKVLVAKFFYLKITATIALSQNFINITTPLVRGYINTINIFFQSLESVLFLREIQQFKISAGLICFCYSCNKQVQVTFILNSACQLQLVSPPTVPETWSSSSLFLWSFLSKWKTKDVAFVNYITFSLLSP